jgi:poly(3-hydroxybutyrate) depolymerase
MHTPSFKLIASCFLFLGSFALACSSSQQTGGTGGSSPSKGGSSSGGTTTSAGGASESGGKNGSGGVVSAGGSSAGLGGATAAGGSTSSGGKAGTGGAGGVGDGGTKGSGGSTPVTSATGGSAAGGSTGGGIDGGTATTGRSAGCGKAPTAITASQYNNGTTIPITAAGLQRRYVLNIPTNYDNSKPYTLVVTIHARDGNDIMMYNWQYYGLLPESKNTAIFAAPNGQKNGAPCSSTAVGDSSCGWPNPNGQDMALMDAVVKQVEENFCVDTNHIYATGWSYGASMSYEVGCERPLGGTGTATWGVRAIAIYSGAQMSGSCKPATPIGFYASHGTHDSVLNYNGGVSLAQNFAKANGCTWATPTSVTSGPHVCTNEAGCKPGYPLEFCSFNGDHTPFPDTGQSAGSWGPAEVWKFFSQF